MNTNYTFKPDHFIAIAPAALLTALKAFSISQGHAGRVVLRRYDCLYLNTPEDVKIRTVDVHDNGDLYMPVRGKFADFATRVNKINLNRCDELSVDFDNREIYLRKGKLKLGFKFDPSVTDEKSYNDFVQSIIKK